MHLFFECNSTKYLWLQLNRHFHSDLTFPVLTPQTAILGLFNDSVSNISLINHIKKLEKVTTFRNVKKVAAYNKNWDITNRKLPL